MKRDHDKAVLEMEKEKEELANMGKRLELELQKRYEGEKQQTVKAQNIAQEANTLRQTVNQNEQEIKSLKAREQHALDELNRCFGEIEKLQQNAL